ncbi:hypothetical protein GCM10009853_066170 [Glycomyces scopariae]
MSETHPWIDPSRPRRARFRHWLAGRIRKLLRDTDPDTEIKIGPIQVTREVNHTETVAFHTPSKGDAYDFSVAADLCFCAAGPAEADTLTARIRDRIPTVTTEVTSAARAIGREHPPFRPGAAEPKMATAIKQAVDSALAGTPDEDGTVYTCNVRIRVSMPEEVRDLQRKAVADQVRSEAMFEQSEQTAQRMGELRDAWSGFIRDGLPAWDTPYAVNMALKPSQVASVLYAMRKDRKQEAQDLVEQVGMVAAEHERLDLLELALVSDSALRKAFELLEIAQPDSGPASNFDESGRGGAK